MTASAALAALCVAVLAATATAAAAPRNVTVTDNDKYTVGNGEDAAGGSGVELGNRVSGCSRRHGATMVPHGAGSGNVLLFDALE